MHTKSDNVEFILGSETDEIIENLFESLLHRYQEGLERSMRGSEFVFDSVDLLYYKIHKTNVNRGESFIDSLEWLRNKQATINPISKNDGKCFQYAVTVALNHEQIKKNLQIITKFKPFIDQYDWNEIEFPSHKNDCKKFESNNNTIALKVLFALYNTKEVRPAYILKYNSNRKNQVIILMITDNNKKWHYLFAKGLSALLKFFRSFTKKCRLKNITIAM